MSGPRAARALVVVASLAAALVLVDWQRSSDACTDSVKGVLFGIRDRLPEPQLAAAAARVEAKCEGSSRLIDSAGVLFKEGYPAAAETLLREAATREPESFSAWAGLASVLSRRSPAEAARAADRARELNPLYRPPS